MNFNEILMDHNTNVENKISTETSSLMLRLQSTSTPVDGFNSSMHL